MWDKLAECTASTIDQFFRWKQMFFGPNSTFPPSPHAMLFVRKGLPKSCPTLYRGWGKGGASEYCSNSGKWHRVPHILARIVVWTSFEERAFKIEVVGSNPGEGIKKRKRKGREQRVHWHCGAWEGTDAQRMNIFQCLFLCCAPQN